MYALCMLSSSIENHIILTVTADCLCVNYCIYMAPFIRIVYGHSWSEKEVDFNGGQNSKNCTENLKNEAYEHNWTFPWSQSKTKDYLLTLHDFSSL